MNTTQTRITKTVIAGAIAVQLAACATVYTDENFETFQTTHKTVAILPFDVTIDRKKLPEDTDLEMIKDSEKEEQELFQKQLYTQFLNRYEKGKYTVKFQDIDETNVLMRRKGMDGENMADFTKAEIGQALGVDSVISGTIKRSKPMSTGAAIATTFLFGFGATNKATVNMNIHDSESGTLLWSYDHEASGGLMSSAEGTAKSLMKNSAKKFPYKKDD